MKKTIKTLVVAVFTLVCAFSLFACAKGEEKTKLDSPTIASKVYTGETLKADVPANEGYAVETNDGGTDVGEYEVVLRLTDAKKYEWNTPDSDDATKLTLKFAVTQATNEITALSLENWKVGETAKTPVATAKFGTPVFTYSASENGTYESAVPTATGTYYVKASVAATANYTAAEKTAQFTIEKVNSEYTAPTAKTGLVYSGEAQALLTAGATEHGTFQYRIKGTDAWLETVPTGTDAGNYTVEYYVKGDDSHLDSETGELTVNVAKADVSVSAPVAASNLVYDGTEKALVTAGTAVGGRMEYKTESGEWGEIPVGTNAGEYRVYYRVVGDQNHNDYTADTPVVVTLAKATTEISSLTLAGWTYGGEAQTPVIAANYGANTVTYAYAKKTEGVYSETLPTDAGDYVVKATIAAAENYTAAEKTAEFTIAKATVTFTAPTANAGLVYSGEAQALVTAGSASAGTIKYKVGEGEYATSLPVATDAGTYTVTYTVELNENYNAVEEGNLDVTIAKQSVTLEVRQSFNLVTATDGKVNADLSEVYGQTRTAEIDVSDKFGKQTVVIEQENYVITLPIDVYAEYDATSDLLAYEAPPAATSSRFWDVAFINQSAENYVEGGAGGELRIAHPSNITTTKNSGGLIRINNMPSATADMVENLVISMRIYVQSDPTFTTDKLYFFNEDQTSKWNPADDIIVVKTNEWVTVNLDVSKYVSTKGTYNYIQFFAMQNADGSANGLTMSEFYVDYLGIYDRLYDMDEVTTGKLTAGGNQMTGSVIDATEETGGTDKLLSLDAISYGTKAINLEQPITVSARTIKIRLYVSSKASSVNLIFIPVENEQNSYTSNVQRQGTATNTWVEITLTETESAGFVKDGVFSGIGFGVWQTPEAGTVVYIDYVKVI